MNGDRSIPVIRESAAQSGCCDPVVLTVSDAAALRRQVAILSALADQTRLGIVSMLAALEEPLCVCDIVSQFQLGQPTISHHLRILREANVVTTEKRGLWVYYSINRGILDEIAASLAGMSAQNAVLAIS